jgi:hypothetical protein
VRWEIEYTREFETWWDELSASQQASVSLRVDLLAEHGPALRRPAVGQLRGSKFDPLMKELRCGRAEAIRVIFAFDPRRTAILLLGGSKAGRWREWYQEAIPKADQLYSVYVAELRREGLI